MKPVNFPQSTKELQRPQGMTEEECKPLNVYCDGKHCISCWTEESIWQRLRFLFSGKIWLRVWYGVTQPPVYVATENPWPK